jgi:hypothetical protein
MLICEANLRQISLRPRLLFTMALVALGLPVALKHKADPALLTKDTVSYKSYGNGRFPFRLEVPEVLDAMPEPSPEIHCVLTLSNRAKGQPWPVEWATQCDH